MPVDSGISILSGPISATDLVATMSARRDDFWFRLFNHATLALAGICLVHGEAYFLPLLPWCLLPYLALLLAAFRAEGRWILPDKWANVAGVAIVVAMALWIRYQPGGPGILKGQEYLVRLVPYIGPFLMALLTVQLFRRRGASRVELRNAPVPQALRSLGYVPLIGPRLLTLVAKLRQHGSDREFWSLQGMGLIQVALGCVLASSPLFGLLMAIYLTSALGCLALHYLAAPGTVGRPPSWRWLLGFVARFAFIVGAFAIVVFLVTPRYESAPWDPLQRFGNHASQQSSRWAPNGPNQGANLNGTYIIEMPRDEAFSLWATDAKGPKLDLSRETRFRSLVLEDYQDGVWTLDGLVSGYHSMSKAIPFQKDMLPDFGPDQFYIHFDVKPANTFGLVLAEPVRLGPYGYGHHIPAVLTDFSRPHAQLFYVHPQSGTLLPVPASNLSWARYLYKQVLAKSKDSDRKPADIPAGQAYIQALTREALPLLEVWTTALLRGLAAEPRYDLPVAVLVPDPRPPHQTFLVAEDQRERIARALCKYLATSGEYTYSLEQRRQNFNIDPIEDFLFNVKEGHCERYASALVLMLRTQGVPARMIKGYRGVEALGGGHYVVRKNMAHAWVEVLVRRRSGSPGGPYEWLTLDPTPGIDARQQPSLVVEWWKDKTEAGATMWKDLIVGYNADQQGKVISALTRPSDFIREIKREEWIWFFLTVAVWTTSIIGFVTSRVRRRRRRAAMTTSAGCYLRLLRLLARRGRLQKAPTQTPRELAATAALALAARPLTADLADLPGCVVDLFYRVRFGGQAPAAAEVARLNARLDQLSSALVRSGPLGSGNSR